MKTILLSAAVLALLGAPAFAQPPEHRVGKAALAPQAQDQAQRQLQAQAGQPGPNGLVMAPPGALPLGTDGKPVRLDNNHPGVPPNPGQAQRQDNRRGDRNDFRGNNDRRGDFRGNDNRGRDNNNFGNRGNDNRGGWNGNRRDYRGFNGYHRSFRSDRRFRAPEYRRPSGWYDRRWSFGDFLPRLFWTQQYWLNDWRAYDLPPPPYGTVWVREGDDALLVDRDTGEIISIEYDVFY